MQRTVIEQNGQVRLKYIKFTDKIKMINPDIIHQIGTIEPMEPDANDSFFRQGLDQWRDLNCTAQFGSFYQQVRPLVETFNQVVFYKDKIIECLLDHLSRDECLAYEPLLSLVAMLAQDLRSEFYAYFPQIVTVLGSMLKKVRQDTLLIEKLFHTLGFVYKYLRKQLAANFLETFDTVKFMISDRQSYVRWFAAPGLAYLMRKCTAEQLPEVIEHLLQSLDGESSDFQEGLAVVLFETVKGTANNFHSRAMVTFELLIDLLEPSQIVVAEKLLILMAVHGDSKAVAKLVILITGRLKVEFSETLLTLLNILTCIRKGSRIQGSEVVVRDTVVGLLADQRHELLLSLVMVLLQRSPQDEKLLQRLRIVVKEWPVDLVIYAHRLAQSLEVEVSLMEQICLRLDTEFDLQLFEFAACHMSGSYYFKGAEILSYFVECLKYPSEVVPFYNVLVTLQSCRIANQKDIVPLLTQRFTLMSQEADLSWEDVALISRIAQTILSYGQKVDLLNLIEKHPKHEVLLQVASLSDIHSQTLYQILKANMQSPLKSVRLNSLKIMAQQEQPNWKDGTRCNIFELMINVEEQMDTAQNAREKLIHIRRIFTACVSKRLLPQVYVEVIPLFCIGQLTVNFKPIWKDIIELLWSFSKLSAVEVTWSLIWTHLQRFGSSYDLSHYELGGLQDDQIQKYRKYIDDQSQAEDRGEAFKDGEFCDSTVFKLQQLRESIITSQSQNFQMLKMLNVVERADYRFDRLNFFKLLVQGVKDYASHVEKHASPQVQQEFISLGFQFLGDVPDTRKRLLAFGEMLTKFKHVMPQDLLTEVCQQLLIRNDLQLQQVALKCLIKIHKLQQHQELLSRLLDEKSFRQTLTTLTLNGDDAVLDKEQKAQVLPVILRILFSKMSAKNAADINKVKIRRTALLSFLTGLHQDEFAMFIDLLLKPYQKNNLTISAHIGFLHKLQEAIKQLGTTLVPFMPQIWSIIVRIGQSDDKQVRAMLSKAMLSLFDLPLSDELLRVHEEYVPQLFDAFISGKLDKFSSENIQAPSALMELFGLWCSTPQFNHFMVTYDARVFPQLLECLSGTGVKQSVVSCVLQAIEDLVVNANDGSQCAKELIKLNAALIIDNIAVYITSSTGDNLSKDVLFRKQIWVLAELVQFAKDLTQVQQLVDLLIPFLKQPDKFVPESTKCDILRIQLETMDSFLSRDVCQTSYYSTVCRLFQTLINRSSRSLLLEVFQIFGKYEVSLQLVSTILADLNSYSEKSVEQPDWNRRMDAYAMLNEQKLSYDQWHPILHSLINSVMYSDEDIIRRSASFSLSKFVDRVVGPEDPLYQLLVHVVFAAVKSGLKSRSEAVCSESVSILKSIVFRLAEDEVFVQLVPLLADGDEEASFFDNIYHVQMHRRSRAMRRFVDILQQHTMKPVLLSKVFIPIMQHFIYSRDKAVEQQTVTDAIGAIGAIAKQLPWNMYYPLVKQYFKLLKSGKLPAKVVMRLIIAVLTNFHWDDDEVVLSTLERVILPELYTLLTSHKEGEANLQLRVPIAIAYAKLLQSFPKETLQLQLPKLLTNISQILRSRGQEVRDVARNTLVTIAAMFKAEYLPFVVKELKSALTKGYQLHVLGYTVHSLLAGLTFGHGNLDRSLGLILPILINDVFGAVALEKEVDELTSKSKEYKNKRGFESFELLASTCSITGLDTVILSLKNLMMGSSGAVFSRNMTDVFRRLCLGAISNEGLETQSMLVLVLELLQQDGKYYQIRHEKSMVNMDNFERNFSVVRAQRVEFEDVNHLDLNRHMFNEFGLRLINGIMKTRQVSELDSLLPLLTRELGSKNSAAVKLSMKICGLVFKSHMSEGSDVVLEAVDKCFCIIERYGQLNHQMVQDSLRLLSSILRDCQSAILHEDQITFILQLIKPELHKSDDHSVTFQFIKAVLNKRVQNDEITGIVEVLNQMMVTHQASHVRQLCRQVSLSYILDYQVGPSHMKRFVDFLVQNLGYVYESGRLSCIEVVKFIVVRFSAQFIEDYGQILCMALSLRLANDDSAKCKVEAAECLKLLLPKLAPNQLDFVTQNVQKWMASQNQVLVTLGIQMVGLLAEVVRSSKELNVAVVQLLQNSLDDREEGSPKWMVTYHSINTITKAYPYVLPIQLLKKCLMDAHLWVRSAATKLLSMYLQNQVDYSTDDIVEFVRISCSQLKSPLLEDKLGSEILINLCRMAMKLPETDKDLEWLCRKMSSMCRDESNSKSPLLRSLIFKWFASLTSQLTSELLAPLTAVILAPVFRIASDEQSKFEGFQELKTTAIELMDMIEKKLGSQQFFAIRNQVEQQVSQKQQERRQKSQQLAVSDPQASAKRKQERSVMKQQARKRKTQQLNEKYGKRLRRLV